MTSIYPYSSCYGADYNIKYWKYQNADPSTAHYAKFIVDKIFDGIRETVDKRGWDIYHVRSDAIIVQDLYHAVIRMLAHELAQHVKEIDQYEQENSGDIRNYGD